MTDSMVERVAIAIHLNDGTINMDTDFSPLWAAISDNHRGLYRARARAAIAAIREPDDVFSRAAAALRLTEYSSDGRLADELDAALAEKP